MTTTKILPAVQKHHPDNPSTGWTVTVLDLKGLLYARFYGTTKRQAEVRARAGLRFPHEAKHDAR
jgi:hypothetical protein